MKKKSAGISSADLNEIIEVYRMMVKEDLHEIKWEQGTRRLYIRRKGTAPQVRETVALPVVPRPESATVDPEPAEVEKSAGPCIESPMNGIFYTAPSPSSPEFAKEGDTVSAGDTVCIIEAMKMMNEIKAECNCRIVKVLAQNEGSVQAGQPLFKIKPL